MQNFVEPFDRPRPMLESMKPRGKSARSGLNQIWQVEMVGAEAHSELAQRRAIRLTERFDLVCNASTVEHTERFCDLKGNAPRKTY